MSKKVANNKTHERSGKEVFRKEVQKIEQAWTVLETKGRENFHNQGLLHVEKLKVAGI